MDASTQVDRPGAQKEPKDRFDKEKKRLDAVKKTASFYPKDTMMSSSQLRCQLSLAVKKIDNNVVDCVSSPLFRQRRELSEARRCTDRHIW